MSQGFKYDFCTRLFLSKLSSKEFITNEISFTNAFKMLQKIYGDNCNILNAFVNEISKQNFKQIFFRAHMHIRTYNRLNPTE